MIGAMTAVEPQIGPRTVRVSTYGVTWLALPFPVGTPGVTNSGSTVRAAAMLDDRLVLVGQSNSQAAFWIMDDPSIYDD